MFFQPLITLALALTVAASPADKRDSPVDKRDLITAETMIADIQGIDSGVNALKASLLAYSGTLYEEGPIPADITAIHLANRKGYADANLRSPAFNAENSTNIVEFTIDSVGVDIPASVDVLKEKKPLFKGQEPLILAGLVLLKNDHDTFSAALVSKLTADQVRGAAVVKKIDDSLQSAIDEYST